MKTLNLPFEDKEFRIIEQAKDKSGSNWHDFILDLCREYILKNLNS